MASLKSLKIRIKSVKSTQKITKAMKMVAASKLKKARDQADAAKPYAVRMENIVRSLASSTPRTVTEAPSLLTGTGRDKVHLVVVATSDRGLCGAFNSSIVKATRKKINELAKAGKEVKLLCLGKKGYDLLKFQYGKLMVAHYDGIGNKGLKFEDAHHIADKILGLFEKREFDCCHIVYNEFKSAIAQEVALRQIIPLPVHNDGQLQKNAYEYEPSEEEILEKLLPKNVAVQLYNALLENFASEQGARMTAMDNATRNSGDIIKKLTLVYNRTRQAHITRELIEIISGAEAV